MQYTLKDKSVRIITGHKALEFLAFLSDASGGGYTAALHRIRRYTGKPTQR